MKFFSSKIVTTPISADALKNAKPMPVRSLEEILASAKQMKTAAANAEVKTAAKTEEATKIETPTVSVKTAADFGQHPAVQMDPAASEPDVISLNPAEEVAPAPVAGTGQALNPQVGTDTQKWQTGAYPVKPANPVDPLKQPAPMAQMPAKPMPKPLNVTPKPMQPQMASTKKTQLKIANKINFTQWEQPQQVSDAWKQHGTHEACCNNVKGMTNDPQTYCTLLRVAASEADKMVKAASASSKIEKTASTKETSKSPIYKKIAKLTKEEHTFLAEFWKKIYGNDYVDAMLGDY